MKQTTRLAFVFICLANCLFGRGQADPDSPFVVDHWQSGDGLPQNTIKVIRQTRDGYLWIGTFDGLVRFDGIQFTVFTVANTPGLPSGDISVLLEDQQGRLWIGTDGEGLRCYHNNMFDAGPGFPEGPSLKVTGLAEYADSELIVATTTDVFMAKRSGWTKLSLPGSNAPPGPFSFLAQNSKNPLDIWLSRGSDLFQFSNGSFLLRHSFSATIGAIWVDADGSVTCGLNNGQLAQFKGNAPVAFSDFGHVIWHCITRTRNGDLWMTSQQGVFRQRGEDDRLHFTKKLGLSSADAGVVFEDSEGNIWVGTNGGGLNRLREKLVRVYSIADGLLSDDVTSIIQEPDGQIWSSSFKGGVSRFDGNSWTPLALPGATPNPDIASLLLTRDGALWMAGHYSPHYRQISNSIERIILPNVEAVRALFEDRDGGFWIGTRDAGVELRKGQLIRRFNTDNGLSRNMVTAIAQDSIGQIWIGTTFGLNRINPDMSITSFFQKDGLGANGIYALCTSSDGTLWIGTASGGLSRFKNGQFSSITQGLPSPVIGQLIEDDKANLWMGTTIGIARAPIADLHDALDQKRPLVACTVFGKSDGLIQAECNSGFQPSCMRALDGSLWFCTIGGLVVIDPNRIPKNQRPPRVHIEKIVVDDRRLEPAPSHLLKPASDREATASGLSSHSILASDTLSTPEGTQRTSPVFIPPGSSRIEIHYTGLSFSAPSKVRFQYFLEGYDSQWVDAGTRRTAYYTHVPPGSYQFRVKAVNNDGVWNDAGAVLPLQVKPLLQETLWFQLLTAVVIAAPIVAALILRRAHSRQVESLRLRIAHDLHDEAGSNLGSIQLLSRRAAKRIAQFESAAPELAEIQRITSATAESIRDVVWLIDPEFDTLGQMLKGFENLTGRQLGDITCKIHWEVSRHERTLSVPFRTHFFLIFKEILHNIQKHAQATQVQIDLTEEKGLFCLRIQDNGIGFDPDKPGNGHGLHSLTNRAARLDGNVQIESSPFKGTVVYVRAKAF